MLASALEEKEAGTWEKGNEVPERIFTHNNMEGFVYLLALYESEGVDIFREDREVECWSVFESYAAGGLKVIEEWSLENPGATDLTKVFLNKMKVYASKLVEQGREHAISDVQF